VAENEIAVTMKNAPARGCAKMKKGCRLAGRPAALATTATHAAVVTLLWRKTVCSKVKNLDAAKHNSFHS